MDAVKLLICREWRQVQAFPRFWLVALGLSLLLATATPTMLLAHYVASFALLSAPFFALGTPATAAGAPFSSSKNSSPRYFHISTLSDAT